MYLGIKCLVASSKFGELALFLVVFILYLLVCFMFLVSHVLVMQASLLNLDLIFYVLLELGITLSRIP